MLYQVAVQCEQQAAVLQCAACSPAWRAGTRCLKLPYPFGRGVGLGVRRRLSPISGIALHTSKPHGIC